MWWFAAVRCKPALLPPHPSISEHPDRSAAVGRTGAARPCWQRHSRPCHPSPEPPTAERVKFCHGSGRCPLASTNTRVPTLGRRKLGFGSVAAGSRATLHSRAGGDGDGCCLPAGIPVPSPCWSCHTRMAGGGKMPISSRRDSTGCSQRCS